MWLIYCEGRADLCYSSMFAQMQTLLIIVFIVTFQKYSHNMNISKGISYIV